MSAAGNRTVDLAQWLREEVTPAYDAWKAGLGRGISPEEMAERARQRHLARLQRNDLAEGDAR